MSERATKSYSGEMMQKGTDNEEAIMRWLDKYSEEILDFRDFRLTQRLDIDFGIETKDGNIILAEVKSDKSITEKENGNFLFEANRINHYVKDKWFYLGWGWRSPAQKLIVRNPKTYKTFVFDFSELRTFIGSYIAEKGRKLRTCIVETDDQKTTFNYLIPMRDLKHLYKKYIVEPVYGQKVLEATAPYAGLAASF